MCGGVQFDEDGQTIKTFFPNPKARLPVRTRQGQTALVPWGRREEQPGRSAQGGWARLESIQQGAWNRYQPRPVKIIVDAFMEKDTEGNSHWFMLEPNQFIQGLIATDGAFTRLYVVTEDNEQSCHEKRRWPRILEASHSIRNSRSLF
ncbi:hypothetical protein GZ77_07790 [Endozoicomonas montiporae]|uniref:Uncharacterized protein n=2 Tax=Endozoicomonas montiporae TaxID=1027273 RepID=A0A081N778_9GAMM|nr:hypothetical protein [Endozoicomonas montiporae]AMO55877.1 hypothetical protein EZMO1_1728 [Endozoicomonas montiporae CL-33]KEQ14301.1 hypothetical protein GZ77_07790 [Endozoicomonas montiporae]